MKTAWSLPLAECCCSVPVLYLDFTRRQGVQCCAIVHHFPFKRHVVAPI